jgi:hypothetical protein
MNSSAKASLFSHSQSSWNSRNECTAHGPNAGEIPRLCDSERVCVCEVVRATKRDRERQREWGRERERARKNEMGR